MGVVYRAWQVDLKRVVALKVIRPEGLPDCDEPSRFRTEAEAIGRLQHPSIVQVFEAGMHAGRPYLALEYVAGGSLADQLRGTPRPAREAAGLVETIARAIDYAHRRGVIHRDLKPANVLLSAAAFDGDPSEARRLRDGPPGDRTWPAGCVPKITDFGLAKILAEGQEGQTRSGDLLGTPSYMAPEQAGSSLHRKMRSHSNSPGPAVDIYSLGATLYELLTGRSPFKAETPLQTLYRVISEDPIAPSRLQAGLPRDLETICLKCLSNDPKRRYASAVELADDLRRYLDGAPIRARAASMGERAWRWCRRNPALALASALASAAIVTAMVLGIGFGMAERRHAQSLERSLAEVRVQKYRVAELAAGATFDRGLTLCEQGESDRGLLMLVDGLRLLEVPGGDFSPPPLARTIRATIGDWMGRSRVLVGFLDHREVLEASALSPDGRLAATGSRDGTARLWSAVDGRLMATLPHSSAVRGVHFAPGGGAILTIAGDAAALWDPRTGARLRSFTHTSDVTTARFDPDGRRLVLTGVDGVARVFDAASGRPLGAAMHHQGPILHALFLPPDGRTLLTASDDRTARCWRVETGQPAGAVMPLTERPVCVAASPGGRSVLIGCRDGTAQLWDTVSGRAAGPPLRHGAEVSSALFRSDGRLLVTGSRDWRVRLWDVSDDGTVGEPRVLRHPAPVTSLALSEDGRTLVTGCLPGQAFVWDLASRTVAAILPHLGDVYRVAIGGDGPNVLVSGQETAARLWRMPRRAPSGIPVPEKDILYAMAFSPDGTMLATAGEEGIARLWDTATGGKLGELHHAPEIRSVVFLPDGRSVVTASADQSAILWELSVGRPLRRFLHAERLDSLAVSPDGHLLLTGSRDGLVTLWEVETGRKRREKRLHNGIVVAVSFSPDGRLFAPAAGDQTAVLGRVDGLERIAPPLRHQGHVWVAVFRPDGKLLLTGGDDKAIHLWDTASGRPFGPSLEHASRVRLAAFTPEGRDVLIGSEAGKSRFWDLASGKSVGAPLDADAHILAARFDPVTLAVITASEGVTILRRPAPQPREGDCEAIASQIQALTGMRRRPGGGTQVLDATEWRQAADRSGPARAGRRIELDTTGP
jgi:WD40 repeat protein